MSDDSERARRPDLVAPDGPASGTFSSDAPPSSAVVVASAERRARAHESGQHLRLQFRSEATGERARRISGTDWKSDEAPTEPTARLSEAPELLEAPSPDRMLFVFLDLARSVGVEMHDEQIAHAFVDAFRGLFPGRRFCVRLIDAATHELSLVYATGRLRPETREQLVLTRAAMERHGLDEATLATNGIQVIDAYQPLFEEGALGFDVPMMDAEQIVGVLAVEYRPGVPLPAWDPPTLVPLALKLASKLRAARLLREAHYLRDYLAQLVEQASAPILAVDASRAARVANRAFAAVLGREREGLIGRDLAELLPAEERARGLAAFAAALRGVGTANLEVRFPRATGQRDARVAFNVAPVADASGEVGSVLLLGRDLTAVRDLEEQILHAEKLATLGQLAAGVVHELNNPLTSISVYGEYLLTKGRRTGADPGDLEKLSRIVEGAARMLRFTRDLVTYARPSGEEPARLSLEEVLDQSVGFCEPAIREANVRVVRDYAAGLPPIFAVRGQLQQVFVNLITNACHAMAEHGQGTLTLRVEGDERALVVRVTDDGVGIVPEHQDRIFEPFFSTKGEGKGTGLGLSIVRNIVQQHGGTIDVSPGRAGAPGTTFEVRFPIR